MEKHCIVMFSGGLDSSLSACFMAEANFSVDLLHFNNGVLISNNLIEIRAQELKSVYPKQINTVHNHNIQGLFRKLALTTLEEDIHKNGVSLICLGCKLAMHIQSIIFCKKNNIKTIVDGSTIKQEKYSEQRPVSLDFIKKLYKSYEIDYLNPVYKLDKKTIKYELFDRGITIHPLEDTCLFSNTFSTAKDESIMTYLSERESICKQLIERSLSYE